MLTTDNQKRIEREFKRGAEIVVSLRPRSIYISPTLNSTSDREVRHCGCAPNSTMCRCTHLHMGMPPDHGRVIEDDHPKMENNISAEICPRQTAATTAETNYQRVIENHRRHNPDAAHSFSIPGEALLETEALQCQDCGAIHIQRIQNGRTKLTLEAFFIRTQAEETACWIEAHSGELLPRSNGQHRYWIKTQPSEFPVGTS